MYTLFDYQKDCCSAIEAARASGKKAALAVMASGLGKTVTIAFDVRSWLSEEGGKGRVLYLCHQNDILAQARDIFIDVIGGGLNYGFFTGLEKSAHRASVVFASLQTMRKHMHFFHKDEFGYVVFDESHHTPASTYLEVIRYFEPKFLVGMTATPDRRDGLNIRSLYGDEVYYLPLEEALVGSLVTSVDYRLLGDEISLEELGARRLWSGADELDKTLFVPKRDDEIAAIIAKHTAELKEPRAIVFASTIARADQLMKSIPGSVSIHSGVSVKERMVRLELFRLGLIKTVVTVDCFNEGVDIPQANVVVFLRSTASPVIFFQQLGRGLRRAVGKEKVIVLDFVGNCERITMLKDLSDAIERRTSSRYITSSHGGVSQADGPTRTVEAVGEPRTGATIRFDERVVQVLEVIKRIRRQRVADVPELVKEYSSRNPLTASHVAAKSRLVVWWKCDTCGDEYEMTPRGRLVGDRCPQCRERVTETNNLSVTHSRLAREYSPSNPVTSTALKASGKELALWRCVECGYEWRTRPKNRTEQGYNCPSCSSLITYYKNNLGVVHPALAEEYSYVNIFPPSRVSARSSKRMWWICSACGQEWMASVWHRADGRMGCPLCTSKVPTERNNLVAVYPHLADEYSTRNRTPVEMVCADTPEKVRWLCSECGRYWDATVRERLDGARCPVCLRMALTHAPTT